MAGIFDKIANFWPSIFTGLSVGIFILKQRCRFCLAVRVGAVPRNTEKAKKERNVNKAASKLLREEGLGRRVPRGSAESEAGT